MGNPIDQDPVARLDRIISALEAKLARARHLRSEWLEILKLEESSGDDSNRTMPSVSPGAVPTTPLAVGEDTRTVPLPTPQRIVGRGRRRKKPSRLDLIEEVLRRNGVEMYPQEIQEKLYEIGDGMDLRKEIHTSAIYTALSRGAQQGRFQRGSEPGTWTLGKIQGEPEATEAGLFEDENEDKEDN